MAGRVFITGDTHRTNDLEKLYPQTFAIGRDELDKDDVVIILGDWGALWFGDEYDDNMLDWWESRPWTTFVILGNHENYNALKQLPVVEKFGAEVYQPRPSVFIAFSGNLYDIYGRRCLCINGADSIDRSIRTEGIDWWKEEAISKTAISSAITNLGTADYKFDYLLTHCGGTEVCATLGYLPTPSEQRLQNLIDFIPHKNYKHYCGHYHTDKLVSTNTRIVYDDIIEI